MTKSNEISATSLTDIDGYKPASDIERQLMQKGLEAERERFVRELLFEKKSEAQINSKADKLGMLKEETGWVCMILTMDFLKVSPDEREEYEAEERLFQKISVEFHELAARYQNSAEIYYGGFVSNNMYYILRVPKGYAPVNPVLQVLSTRILQFERRSRRYVLTVGLGRKRDSLSELKTSREHICRMFQLRHISGVGSVLLEPEHLPKISEIDKIRLPLSELERLIRNGDEKKARTLVEDFYRGLKTGEGISLYDARLLTTELVRCILKTENEEDRDTENIGQLRPFGLMCSLDGMQDAAIEIAENTAERKRESGNRKTKLVERALEYIHLNYHNDKLTLQTTADSLNISIPYLTLLFRTETDKTFGEHLLETRMEIAKELLRTTDESVTRISSKVGYSSSQYFSTCFRNYTGMPPGRYRENR